MDERDRYAKGMEVRRAVLGDATWIEVSPIAPFNQEFQDLIRATHGVRCGPGRGCPGTRAA
jgi:hypothetical protein